jgi:hypothetical protein
LTLYACLRMYQSTLIAQSAIASYEDVVGDSLSEYFDLEDIRDNFLCFPVNVWMHQCDVIIACDDIPQSGKTLFNPLESNSVRERVP